MSDDIVTRLRICGSEYGSGETCLEAANYIETLRREVHYWYEKWRDLEVGRVND